MVITKSKSVYAIDRLTKTELEIIFEIVLTADRRCFDEQDNDGVWYSNDDFVVWLSDKQRTALAKLGEEIGMMYNDNE
jgi:hypothetical protein